MADDTALVTLSILGTITSVTQNASGFPLLRRVIEEKDSTKYSKIPLITMTGTTVLIGLYGWFVLRRLDGFIACNAIGAFFWLINYIVFVIYSPNRRSKLLLSLVYWLTVILSVLLYIILWFWIPDEVITQNTRATIVAVIMQTFNISGFASPFRSLVYAIQELDTKRVPRMLSFVNLINSSLWTAYGYMLSPADPWIYAPNIVGVIIAIIQIKVLIYIEIAKKFSKNNLLPNTNLDHTLSSPTSPNKIIPEETISSVSDNPTESTTTIHKDTGDVFHGDTKLDKLEEAAESLYSAIVHVKPLPGEYADGHRVTHHHSQHLEHKDGEIQNNNQEISASISEEPTTAILQNSSSPV